MSFDFDVTEVLRYAFNTFGSVQPILYLFVGAAFAAFVLGILLKVLRKND